jgi:hypothetical protein
VNPARLRGRGRGRLIRRAFEAQVASHQALDRHFSVLKHATGSIERSLTGTEFGSVNVSESVDGWQVCFQLSVEILQRFVDAFDAVFLCQQLQEPRNLAAPAELEALRGIAHWVK